MSSSCYLCYAAVGAIPGRQPGDALGTCQNCSVLACSAHAQRDPNYPRWICVLCDTSLLTAAGIASSDMAAPQVQSGLLIPPRLYEESTRYRSLEDFLRDRPEYDWVRIAVAGVVEQAPARFTTDLTESFWFTRSREGQRFIAAAIAIAQRLEIPEDELIEALRILVREWRR